MSAKHLIIWGLILLTGCARIGPVTVERDRFEYTVAISESWKSQMLMNIVRLRYGDPPVFLDVGSIINQYLLDYAVNAGISWSFPPSGNSQQIGGAARYAERPTITYSPVMGERFARSIMTPISPTAVLSLIQAGYPVDLVMRVAVHSINGVRNRYGGTARARAADPEFYPLLALLRKIQDSGAIGLRVREITEREGGVLVFRGKVEPEIEEEIQRARNILGLDPKAREFSFAYGAVPKDNRELALLTRSIFEILIDFASLVDVPPGHVEEKRVDPTISEKYTSGAPVVPLIQIHSSRDKPGDSFAAVSFRNYWFWIDDRDLVSKKMFSFVMMIFSLTETGGKEGAPIVTIPAG